MLVVRQRRAPVAAPPFHLVPGVGSAGKEDVEGDREDVRMEASTHSVSQAAVGWTGDGGSFRIFAHDESQVHRNRECSLRRKRGGDSEGEEGGPGPP